MTLPRCLRQRIKKAVICSVFFCLFYFPAASPAYPQDPQKQINAHRNNFINLTLKKNGNNFKDFAVYIDAASRRNHFSAFGWMGDFGDIRYTESCKDIPFSGSTCIKINYTAEKKQGVSWAGMYWQWPPNNWGEKRGGFDLSGAKKLTFWARGERGGEKIAAFKAGGIPGKYPDTATAEIGPITLSAHWNQYTIDLSRQDMSHVIGGFCWAANTMDNPCGCTFFLDDIKFE